MPLKEKYAKFLKPQKSVVSAEEVVSLRENSEAAKRILFDPEFKFFRDYLRNVKKSLADSIIQNRVKGVTESTTDQTTGVTKTFEISKEEQLNEMSGQYKLVEMIFADLATIVSLPEEFKKAEDAGEVEIKDSKEG